MFPAHDMSIATIDDSGGTDLNEGPSTSSLFTTLMLGHSVPTGKALLQCAFCGQACSTVQLCLFCGTVAYCSKEHQQIHWNTHKLMCKSLQSRGMVQSNMVPPAAPMLPPAPVSFDDPALTTSLLLSLQNNALLSQGIVGSFPPTFSLLAQPTEPEPVARQIIPSSLPAPIPSSVPFSSEGSAFKPYRSTHVFNSLSSESVSSLALSTSHEASLDHMSSPSLPRFPTSSQSDIGKLATISAQVLNIAGDSSASLQSSAPIIVAPTSSGALSTSSSCKKGSSTGYEKIIETDDPDIQIIETDSTTTSNVTRTRKRPTPSNSAGVAYKDHNKNLVYSTTLQEHQKHLQNRGLAVSQHQAMVLRLRYIAEHAIRSLNEFGWAVVDNFIGTDHYKYTANEIERLYERGLFTPGQLMEGKHKDEFHIKDIRSDHIYWFDGCDQKAKDAATVRLLISMIDSVIQHFKKRIDHEIGGRSRAMLAIYPGNGTRYVKHVDNPVKDGRCITTIYYCNENWDMTNDGGTLRLYPETSMTPMDIDPRADRLVFFWSDRRNPHEVMPVFRHRFAITIWYMDKTERDRALAKTKETDGSCASKKENEPSSSPSNSQLGTPSRPRKNPSSHDLSNLDLRLFPTTSSDPTLGLLVDDKVDVTDFQSSSSLAHPESTDSGVSLSTLNDSHHHHHHHLERASSLQSISDDYRSARSAERRSSTSSEQDLDEGLPVAPSNNPEYMI